MHVTLESPVPSFPLSLAIQDISISSWTSLYVPYERYWNELATFSIIIIEPFQEPTTCKIIFTGLFSCQALPTYLKDMSSVYIALWLDLLRHDNMGLPKQRSWLSNGL